jgi:lysophospholipase L1-like esterase
MRLSFNDIRCITLGAHKIEELEDGIHFYKCTEKQNKAWAAYSEVLGTRALTTTGIRLDFYTNSKTLVLKNKGGSFDIKLNGVLRGKTEASGEQTISLTDVRGRHQDRMHVTLIFPSHSVGVIEYVELDDGAYFEPAERSMRIMFIGDSITQGYNSEYNSTSYAWRVTDHYGADALINGIGGAFFAPDTFDVPSFDPDVLVIAYGTNDYSRNVSLEEKHARVSGYLDLIKAEYSDKKVIVISPIWRCNEEGVNMPDSFDEFRTFIENEARARGFYAICGLSLVPPIRKLYADGHLHPNDLGFAAYAENLIKQMNEIIG